MKTQSKFSTKIIENAWQNSTSNNENKYSQLYKVIKRCITDFEIPNNWMLPSTRLLAENLNISRTTVIKAYDLLKLEKLILSKHGLGYFVNYKPYTVDKNLNSEKITDQIFQGISERSKSFLDNYALLNRDKNEFVAFRPGLPPLDIFPVNQWKKLLNNYWRYIKSSSLSYSQTTGLASLKESLREYLYISRNIKCDAEQITILSGSLQSMYIIGNTLLNPRDPIILENPTFPNVLSIFKSLKSDIIPVNVDKNGIDVQKLNAIKSNAKLIHLTPSNHYPLGVKMSLEKRKEILNWASKKNCIIIENDYENEIANHAENLPTIFSLDKENRTVYMGTFNRLLHPSIRIGFMVVPKYLIKAVNALQEHSHRFVAPSIQVVMNQFIEKNYLYQHLKNIISVSQHRHKLFIDQFSKFQNIKLISSKYSSLHVVGVFTTQNNSHMEEETIKKLSEQNITAFSLSKCYISNEKKYGLIFGYSAIRENLLNKKLIQLGNVLS